LLEDCFEVTSFSFTRGLDLGCQIYVINFVLLGLVTHLYLRIEIVFGDEL